MKCYDRLKEFLDDELEDYSAFGYEIHFEDEVEDVEYYEVTITVDDKDKDVYFKVDSDEIYVKLHYDGEYEICRTYDFTIKRFWMALLSWDI